MGERGISRKKEKFDSKEVRLIERSENDVNYVIFTFQVDFYETGIRFREEKYGS